MRHNWFSACLDEFMLEAAHHTLTFETLYESTPQKNAPKSKIIFLDETLPNLTKPYLT